MSAGCLTALSLGVLRNVVGCLRKSLVSAAGGTVREGLAGELAEVCFALGYYREAIDVCERAVEHGVDDPLILNHLKEHAASSIR